ncbi:hypothetical protein MPSEU_001010900 [Mayamaea pseudoterrestris]|nr:hypothetical protein MPSEU_001010900 [Mayamaea pseudoterrestris]
MAFKSRRLLLTWTCLSFAAAASRVTTAATFSDGDPDHGANSQSVHGQARQLQPRIVGGSIAPLDKYPYFVAAEQTVCGGSLIWKDIVLTAGHCKGSAWSGDVVVGATMANAAGFVVMGGQAEKIAVRTKVRHPNYNWFTVQNDFMVVALDSVATNVTEFAQLYNGGRIKRGQPLTVIGFGATNQQGTAYSKTLREVNISYVADAKCVSSYRRRPYVDSATMLCAGAKGKDSCSGDSGGPLMNQDGQQVGVVSWGSRLCADDRHPGVYSRVSSSFNWIWTQICTLSQSPPLDTCGAFRRRRKQRSLRRANGTDEVFVSSTGSCSDSSLLFDLGDQTEKDCAWLKEHRRGDGGDLCDWLHIADRCPGTCDLCVA